MEEHTEEYGLVYKSLTPYEVLYTKWLPYEDVLKLKRIEEMVEVYYNSGQFSYTLEHLTGEFATPFAFFEQLGEYYEKHAFHMISHSRITRYEILLGFVEKYVSERVDFYRELLVFDLYLRENIKSRPVFAGENTVDKEWLSGFYEEVKEHKYLRGYEKYDKRQLRKMTHIEKFNYDVLGNGTQKDTVILFDYQNRSKLNYQATIFRL